MKATGLRDPPRLVPGTPIDVHDDGEGDEAIGRSRSRVGVETCDKVLELCVWELENT